MLFLEFFKPLEDNKLDVIVSLRAKKAGVRRRRCPDGRRGAGEGDESPASLVGDGGGVGGEHLEEDADEAGFLGRLAAADFAGQLKDEEGEALRLVGWLGVGGGVLVCGSFSLLSALLSPLSPPRTS